MKFSHSKHFWTWFQSNSDLLRKILEMEYRQREYWLREVATHLRAFTKNLFCEFLQSRDGRMLMIITAYGKVEYFRMAEKFVAKAPNLEGWKIVALQPPGMLQGMLVPMFGKAGIDIENLWFLPPKDLRPAKKIFFEVYAELYKEVTTEMMVAVEAVLYNLLGEKAMGLEFDGFEIENVFLLPPEQKDDLLRIEELPAWIENKGCSNWCITENGCLENRKK